MAELLLLQEWLDSTKPALLLALFVEPLIQFIGGIAIIAIALNHYHQTRNRGALLIVIALLSSVVSSVTIELGAAFIDDAGYEQVALLLQVVDGILLVILIVGFYLICRNQRTTEETVSYTSRKL
ncbi:MAG: hypothetical protein VYD53_16950 [Pseudomonadota bacterium]|nr:hypothetical protein [Pseudomonadota bacterium]